MNPKLLCFLFGILASTSIWAQTAPSIPCEWSTDVKDSIGTYKSLKDIMLYEKVFGGKQLVIYVALAKENQNLFLEVTHIQKGAGFLPALCWDANSRIILQLLGDKACMLPYAGSDMCGSLIKGADGQYHRVLTGRFSIPKALWADLKKGTISLARFKFAAETVDLIIKSELQSETDKKRYFPERLFVDRWACLEN